MLVWTVEPASRKTIQQPRKQGLVAHMHAKRDLWLLPIAPERPFSDQQAD